MATRSSALQFGDKCIRSGLRGLAAAALSLTFVTAAIGGQTDLAALPLITSSPQIVKPNMMFILDDSGSMGWSHMPDVTEDFGQTGSGTKKYGYASAQCNGVYYNPSFTYNPPAQVAADGTVTFSANASFSDAWKDGYDPSGGGTTDLRDKFRAWTKTTVNNTALNNTDDTEQAAYYYTYSGSETTSAKKNYFDTNSTFYKECNSTVGNTPGSGVFTKVTVSSTSGPGATDERTNFANWYSYYRTRMLMMKTATGLALRNIDDKYRIGYMSINNNVDPSFLNIQDFVGAHKSSWYTKLYGATPNNRTPLREALSNAGRMYAGQLTSLYGETVTDPVQYSCQKNFTLLSTDGYWNNNAGFREDGTTAIGNADAGQQAPFGDGGTVANVYVATLDVTAANGSSQVTEITAGGKKILSGTATSSGAFGTRAERLAKNIAVGINNCTSAITGNCTIKGYKATYSGTVVSIIAPASVGALSSTPGVVSSNTTIVATAFTGGTLASGGNSDTLADVAMYYFDNDLRASMDDNVLPGGDDTATWQHMNTFTLGLGARGRMIYSSTYKADTSGDYYSVKTSATASSTVCTWQTSGTTCTWPAPGDDKPENIDDLWHAAVNGRGQYFSTTDPNSLAVGLNSALQAVTAMTSDSAAATTSNPNVTAGDNYIFSSTFRSADWYGDLERRQVDTVTGDVSAAADWTAAAQLDAKASRTIYTFDASAPPSKLKAFQWANLTAAEQNYFKTDYMQGTSAVQNGNPALSQFCPTGVACITGATQTAAGGANLVNFLRGDRTNEGTADVTNKAFRARTHVLGDIVNSEAVYVKRSLFDYVDAGYSAFKTANDTRTAMVYVGANDGMLHAFNANTGDEAWAYVPKLLMPTLYRLADKFYASNHVFYVDGSPTVGEAYFGGAWHTVLVGGFNDGGRGYYALDVTDPASPKALWEFNPTNMGLSFGRPEITKLANGTWVAIFTSGYNNVNPGNGQGYLYVVNLQTGATISTIGTGVGSDTGTVPGACATAPCPSGLGQIRAWVDNTRYDNTTTKVYGGDLYGNLWRFDVNDTIGPAGVEAQRLTTLLGPTNAVQSITARPELGKVAGYPVVFVGTGRYLGGTDLTNTDVQSIYAVKDNGSSTAVANPRSDVGATGFVQQTLTTAACPAGSQFCPAGSTIRTSSSNGVNFATQKGWFVDLPGARERSTTDPQLALGTLAVTTNVLNPSACQVGGSSFINFFDYRTGQAIQGAGGMVSVFLGNALATRPVQLKFADGTVRSLVRMSDNTWQTPDAPIPPSGLGTRRTSWRELVIE